jgi:hypothetical protein
MGAFRCQRGRRMSIERPTLLTFDIFGTVLGW